MRLEAGAASDVGRVRERNEDSFLAGPTIYAVADGMGGHAAGDVASRIAVEQLAGLAGRDDLRAEDVVDAVHRANAAIIQAGVEHRERLGMGTTVTGLAVVAAGGPPQAAVFNVGDSRVYRFDADGLKQVTADHNEVAELLAAGRITAEQAAVHPLRNVLTRSLGTERTADPDVTLVPLVVGDRFLACSDGVPLEVDEATIAAVLGSAGAPQDVAEELVRAAVEAGGRDNATVVVVDVRD